MADDELDLECDERDEVEGADELNSLTLQSGPLPQAGSWPLSTPRGVEEHFAALRRGSVRRGRSNKATSLDEKPVKEV